MVTASLDEKISFLKEGANYGLPDADVSVRETHTSWVFLVGDSVYKMKKPIRLPALDLTTLEAREHNCREELRLNRRLAADVYRDVIPLVERADGSLRLGGAGIAVEWLVTMKRLPERRMLDVLLSKGELTVEHLQALCDVLSAFYAATARPELRPEKVIASFEDQQALNREILLAGRFDIDLGFIRSVVGNVDRLLERSAEDLKRRVDEGRYVEGHGDLRPEHICFTEPLAIFDCLEFSRTLRIIDPFDEIAFLGMECRYLGANWIEPVLRRRLAALMRDDVSERLYRFYQSFRALMRARMALGHLHFGSSEDIVKWRGKTYHYAELAARYAEKAEAT